MNPNKPYASSCDENRQPILEKISVIFSATKKVLEIGSGTGQHAVYFGKHLPHTSWQTSDTLQYHAGILQWIEDAGQDNVLAPLELDVSTVRWESLDSYDGIFSANTVHIMNWHNVCDMFDGIGRILSPGGYFCLYGPFNYNGEYTSRSNAEFDTWLKSRDPHSGIRNIEALLQLGNKAGLKLLDDLEMPVNNRLLVWQKNQRERR